MQNLVGTASPSVNLIGACHVDEQASWMNVWMWTPRVVSTAQAQTQIFSSCGYPKFKRYCMHSPRGHRSACYYQYEQQAHCIMLFFWSLKLSKLWLRGASCQKCLLFWVCCMRSPAVNVSFLRTRRDGVLNTVSGGVYSWTSHMEWINRNPVNNQWNSWAHTVVLMPSLSH